MRLVPGASLGRYQIVEQIGRGGMATVYKAYQPALARFVAIKVLPEYVGYDARFRERFQREAVMIASLRHPHILTVFDYGEDTGYSYIVTELVDGGTLADRLGQPLSLATSLAILAPVASALDYAHARGIVHRDVKPSNVLLTRDGIPILADFGVARLLDAFSSLTGLGGVLGTPAYMAPEQASGWPVDAAADRYALGVVAYEMLTGRVPYIDETPQAVLLAHIHRPLPLPRQVNPAVGQAVEAILMKALAKHPRDRYATSAAFVAALTEAERRSSDPSTPSGSARRTGAPPADDSPTPTPGIRRPPTVVPSAPLPPTAGSSKTASRWPLAGAAAAALILVGLLATWWLDANESPTAVSPTLTAPAPTSAAAMTPAPQAQAPALQPAATGAPPTSAPSVPTAPPTLPPATPVPPTLAPPTATTAALAPTSPTATPEPTTGRRLPPGWSPAGSEAANWLGANQTLITGRIDNGNALLLFERDYTDVEISAVVSTPNREASLAFRVRDPNNLYLAIFIPDGIPFMQGRNGGVWLYRATNGVGSFLAYFHPSPFAGGGDMARLRVVARGPDIRVFYNDAPIIAAHDAVHPSGKVGLRIYADAASPCDATFANVQHRPL